MNSLSTARVIETLYRYDLLNLDEDPLADRRRGDWEIKPFDIGTFPRRDERDFRPSMEVQPRTSSNSLPDGEYVIDPERLRDTIVSTRREDLPQPTAVDALAWYLPIHYYGPDWGIFLREDAIEMLAGHIWDRVPQRTGSPSEVLQAWQAAAYTLYLHEAFHHKIESFAIRLEIARTSRVYVPYFERVYRATAGTDFQVEEIVATNEMYRRLNEGPYRGKLEPRVYDAVRRFLQDWIPTLPESYRLGNDFGAAGRLNDLCSQVAEATEYPTQPSADWDVAPQMTRGLFSKDTVVYILVPRSTTPGQASGGAVAQLSTSLRDLHRYLVRREGYVARPDQGKGGHTKYVHESRPMIVLPNAKDVSPVVMRSTKQALGFKSVRELAEAARRG